MKNIICILQSFYPEQLAKIQEAAPTYEVVDASKGLPADLDFARISIVLGWDQQLTPLLTAGHLQWIQTISAGVDRFDFQSLAERHILLSNASGIHSISIAEHVLGVLLSDSRGIRQSVKDQERQVWAPKSISYYQLSGKNMMIAGTGHIGRQIALSAQALGINTYGINTSGHPTEGFHECYAVKNMIKLVDDMDIVVNTLPLTDETYHFFNESMFQAMKPETIFVNVGRGPSVNTEDLIQALTFGQLRFAALDVFEEEPLPKTSPLWTMSNVLITPHIAGMTRGFREKLLQIFLTNLESFQKDGTLALNQVDVNKEY